MRIVLGAKKLADGNKYVFRKYVSSEDQLSLELMPYDSLESLIECLRNNIESNDRSYLYFDDNFSGFISDDANKIRGLFDSYQIQTIPFNK
jgi:hypothetical protein